MRTLTAKQWFVLAGVGIIGLSAANSYAINAMDANDDSQDEYVANRVVDVSQGNGQIDLSTLPKSPTPMRLELRLQNNSPNPVNVRIPELKVSYLVQPSEERVQDLNILSVGSHGLVDFTAEPLTAATSIPSTGPGTMANPNITPAPITTPDSSTPPIEQDPAD